MIDMAIMISSNLRINNHQRTLRKQLFFHLNIHGSITYLSLNIELPDTEGNRVTENGRNFIDSGRFLPNLGQHLPGSTPCLLDRRYPAPGYAIIQLWTAVYFTSGL